MILIRKGDFSLKRRPKGDQKWSKSLLRRPWSPKGDLISNPPELSKKRREMLRLTWSEKSKYPEGWLNMEDSD